MLGHDSSRPSHEFEIYNDAAGKFRFRLKAGSGEIVAVGEAYESRASVLKGVESVKQAAAEATVDDNDNRIAQPGTTNRSPNTLTALAQLGDISSQGTSEGRPLLL